jgi:hypothetical protein
VPDASFSLHTRGVNASILANQITKTGFCVSKDRMAIKGVFMMVRLLSFVEMECGFKRIFNSENIAFESRILSTLNLDQMYVILYRYLRVTPPVPARQKCKMLPSGNNTLLPSAAGGSHRGAPVTNSPQTCQNNARAAGEQPAQCISACTRVCLRARIWLIGPGFRV